MSLLWVLYFLATCTSLATGVDTTQSNVPIDSKLSPTVSPLPTIPFSVTEGPTSDSSSAITEEPIVDLSSLPSITATPSPLTNPKPSLIQNLTITKTPVTTAPSGFNVPSSIPDVLLNDTQSVSPSEELSSTESPSTEIPATNAPVTGAPSSIAPITKAPSSTPPETDVPTTASPTTMVPITMSPVTKAPITKAPITKAPVTDAPSTKPPTTRAPVTESPTKRTARPVTKVPTLAFIKLADRFQIRLYSVSARMSKENSDFFGATTQKFLADLFESMEQPIYNITIQVVGQALVIERRGVRTLQHLFPLDVDMTVEGQFDPSKHDSKKADDINLGKLCNTFFDAQGDELIDKFKDASRNEDSIYFSKVETVTSTDQQELLQQTMAPRESAISNNGLAIGGIVAIAVCGTLAILLIFILICQRLRKTSRRTEQIVEAHRTSAPITVETSSKISDGYQSSAALPVSTKSGAGGGYSSSNYEDGSDLQSNLDGDTIGGADTMSYAYSLDHGIEGSTIGGIGPGSEYSHIGRSGSISTIPIEIPMVPSMTSIADYSLHQTRLTRDCFAPPGRLGIVIDTTVEGPVVHKVNAGSPLEGIVWPGDIIVAIDETQTKSLSANEITALMAKNMNKRRKLTILSDA
jgi:hypothetical protein